MNTQDQKFPTDRLVKAREFYDSEIFKRMIDGLEKTLNIRTHYITALSCFIYTEIIGILLPTLDKETGKVEQKRFYRCFFRFESQNNLREIDDLLLNKTGKPIYQHLRHGLCHSYFPSIKQVRNGNTSFVRVITGREIFFKDHAKTYETDLPVGFDDMGGFFISTKQYVRQLKKVIEKSYNKTFIENDMEYQRAAVKGIDFIYKNTQSS